MREPRTIPRSARAALVGFVSALAMLIAAAPAGAAASRNRSAPAPAALPPALQALEAKLAQLQLSSVKLTAAFVAEGPGRKRSAVSRGPFGPFGTRARDAISEALFSLTEEVSFVEQKASFEGSVFGIPVSGRVIGHTTYTREPAVASVDHGRPWVRSVGKEGALEGIGGLNIGAPGAVSGDSPHAFGEVVSELAHARSIVELPPRVLDEQPVTGFVASVPAGAGEGGSAPRSGRARRRAQPLQRYEVFFAENGVPLLVRESMRSRRGQIAFFVAQSVAWINQPIAPVLPPPASETITQAQLERLTSRHRKARKIARSKQ